MISKMLLIALSLVAMICPSIAVPDPQYQKPTTAYPVLELTDISHCGSSSFTYFGNKDKMVPIKDCNNLLAKWNHSHFAYKLSLWENSTALADHFFVLATNGSCQFALKRLDGLDNTIMLGDQDIRDVVGSSIASSRDGVSFETVEGQMNCDTDPTNGGEVNFEWTLRTPGSTN